MDTGLVYADIICSADSSSRRSSNFIAVPQADHRICPRWHRIVLWISCTGNVLLMVAVILMWVNGLGGCYSTASNRTSQNSQEMTGISYTHQCKEDENKPNKELEKFRTCLRQHLCNATYPLAENGSCSVCPLTWLPYEDKCYWISTKIQSWNESYKDCAAKRSQLLVISSTGQQEFFQDKISDGAWIGLTFKLPEEKWMWVNGSPSNQTRPQSLKADCGTIIKKGIASDMCNAELPWICQKPSVII
ncbi:killer cell lectin-like receptor subfamily B member 1B allele C [Erythrolamprus reginae]|uniref:killer cell lectin-like receptor subfamily B member 1B allele C n=1 Tax=Erythrolamprus reginae TaxID=121349 RepID=UPI00396C841F